MCVCVCVCVCVFVCRVCMYVLCLYYYSLWRKAVFIILSVTVLIYTSSSSSFFPSGALDALFEICAMVLKLKAFPTALSTVSLSFIIYFRTAVAKKKKKTKSGEIGGMLI